MNNAYVSENDLTSAICDLTDVMDSLPPKIKRMSKDNDDSEITIGDCLDDVMSFLDGLKKQFGKVNQGNLRW